MATFGIVIVTVDQQVTAQEIAQALVSDRLAACVNLFPIHSVYRWEGTVEQSPEWQLVMKTDLELFDKIVEALSLLHPYEVPEVLAFPIQQGYGPYVSWLGESVRSVESL